MAYLDQDLTKEGTKLVAVQRGKNHKIGVVKMPFVPSGYFKGWKDFWLCSNVYYKWNAYKI